MKVATLLGIIFRVCKEIRVSDIQMRSDRPVYIHTNKGVEKLDFLGIDSAQPGVVTALEGTTRADDVQVWDLRCSPN